MNENNKLIILICTLIFALSGIWYVLLVFLGFISTNNQIFFETNFSQMAKQDGPSSNSAVQPKASIPTTPSPSPEAIPQEKFISGGKHMFQTFNNCGPASLSMALSYYGYNVSQQELGLQLRPHQNPNGNNDDKSVTLQELAAKGKEFNLIPYHRAAGNIEIIQQFVANDIPVITRTWLEPGEDIGHYRVVKGYDRTSGELIQDDSLQGRNLRYTHNEFEEIWEDFSYEFLVLVPEEKVGTAEAILANAGISTQKEAWQKALKLADEAVSMNSSDPFPHFNRSVALYHLGRFQESVQAYEKSAPRLPSRTLWYQIEPILAYYENGNSEKVLSLTAEILNNHNRAFSELYYLRSKVYEDLGNTIAAEEELRKAELYNHTGSWRENI